MMIWWGFVINKEISWYERAEKVVNRVNTSFPNPEFENWDLCEELLEHENISFHKQCYKS
jgi:hypothetical protein